LIPETAVIPTGRPFIFCVHVFVKSSPALAIGRVLFTETMMSSEAVQPVVGFVAVSVYVVVAVGAAVGFETVGLLNPVVGDQE
jgi:hypothetical protein